MYYRTLLPVASLKQLLVCFQQHREAPRPHSYMPNFLCHSYLTQCWPGLVLFNRTVDFTIFLVWTPPTAF